MKNKKQKTILLVEDDTAATILETHLLKGFGYNVVTAKSGKEAVKIAIGNKKTDLVLMDINLGAGMDGTEAARQILRKRNLPIVFLTSHSGKEYVERVKEITRYGYIMKDSDKFVIQSSIEMAFNLFEAGEMLRNSKEEYSVVVERANDGIVILQDGIVKFSNPSLAAMLGYKTGEVAGMNLSRFIPQENLGLILGKYQKRMAGEKLPAMFETVLLHKSGKKIFVEVNGGVIQYRGKPADLVLIRDITGRKQMEAALKKNVQLLRDTGEIAKVGGWELDLSTKKVSWTEEVGRIHGVEAGYKPKLAEALDFYAPESRADVEAVVKKCAETGEPYDLVSLFIPRGSKDKIWIRSLGKAVYSGGGKIVKLAGTFQNIDKYKRAEDVLRATLKEKDVLVREIHHRVKNNMQIISSLLQLQSDEINDDASRRLFNDAQDRIRSMALVHEKLYKEENLATIEFTAYIKDLITHLFRSYGINDERIHFRLDAAEVKLGMDDAIPVALILNELISNSLKHAFPNKREGEISMRIEDRQEKVIMEITDNGIGMAKDVQINSTKTLGLKIVQVLTEQINGSLELVRRDGTRFILSFKKKGYKTLPS